MSNRFHPYFLDMQAIRRLRHGNSKYIVMYKKKTERVWGLIVSPNSIETTYLKLLSFNGSINTDRLIFTELVPRASTEYQTLINSKRSKGFMRLTVFHKSFMYVMERIEPHIDQKLLIEQLRG